MGRVPEQANVQVMVLFDIVYIRQFTKKSNNSDAMPKFSKRLQTSCGYAVVMILDLKN